MKGIIYLTIAAALLWIITKAGFFGIIAIIGLLIILIGKMLREGKDNVIVHSETDYHTNGSKSVFIDPKSIHLPFLKGYVREHIAGVSYRGFTRSDVGVFNGYAEAEPNNKYDKYAIAIHRNDGRLMGYFPGGEKELSEYIQSKGGCVPAHGFIAYNSYSGYYWGEVNVQYDDSAEPFEMTTGDLYLKKEAI